MVERTPIQLPPGVVRRGSEAEVGRGSWYETQLIRWVGGVMRPIGGWEKIAPLKSDETPFVFASTIRRTHTWITLDDIKRTAILCEKHLYVMTESSTDVGGGVLVDAGYVEDITPVGGIQGADLTVVGGYGDFNYSFDLYGTPRPDKPEQLEVGPMWTLDNWGDDLIAMASTDGSLLRWKPSDPPGTKASRVPTSPLGRFFVVTPERHVMIFQHDDIFNRFGWSTQEDIEDWNFASTTNSAGFYDMQPAMPFVTAVVTRSAIIAFTTKAAYAITYFGSPYFYSYNFLGYYNAPVSGNAITQASSGAAWYALDGFWMFDGTTINSLNSPVLDYIQRTIDPVWQYRRVHAFYLGSQSELWFLYPGQNEQENSLYVIYNFDEKWWSMGKLRRTCGTPGSSISYPILSDGTSLFYHEKGLFYADAPELPYAQTGAINIASGAKQCTARQGIVDTRAPIEDVQFFVTGRRDRVSNGTEIADKALSLAARGEGGKLDFRVTGRDLIFRIQSTRNGVQPWTFGQMLVKLFPRGAR
jgi:hypothetical protein